MKRLLVSVGLVLALTATAAACRLPVPDPAKVCGHKGNLPCSDKCTQNGAWAAGLPKDKARVRPGCLV